MKNSKLKEKIANKAIQDLIKASAILDDFGLAKYSAHALKIASQLDDESGPVLYRTNDIPFDSVEDKRLKIVRSLNNIKEIVEYSEIGEDSIDKIFEFLKKINKFLGL
jgi:hypothetical protein